MFDIEDDLNVRRLCKQITHLQIDFTMAGVVNDSKTISNTFVSILSLCDQLIELEFSERISEDMRFLSQLNFPKINFLSTTLTKLKITVACFYDCLFLLDGRLDALSILIINVEYIFDPHVDIGGKVSQTTRSSQCGFSFDF